MPVHSQLLGHMLESLLQAFLIHHLLETSGASLIGGNTIQRFSEYLMTFGTSEPTNAKDQVDFTLKASHVPNTASIILVDVSTHIPTTRTDGTIKVNAAVESGFLFCFINVI
jgi:hypothetical protein